MTEATTVIEVRASTRGLVITEKYMGFVNYVYPMVVNWPAKHRVFRETLLKTMFSQIELFHLAAKSDQASRLYAAAAVQAELRRMQNKGAKTWVLKTDFSKYFYSVKRDVLHAEYRRKLSCKPTLNLLGKIVPASGVGLPIGNLTSQLSANIYGHIIDRWLAHKVGITRFFRYMDDIVVLGHSREALDLLRLGMQWFAEVRMGLKFSKWSIQPAARGINFVGYRIWPGHKLLRKDSVLRARRKINRYTRLGLTGQLDRFLASWSGHARWADSHNLMKSLGVTP